MQKNFHKSPPVLDLVEMAGEAEIAFIDDAAAELKQPSSFIFDPDLASAEALSAMLRSAGVHTSLYADGPAFADGLAEGHPDMVFLDVGQEGDDAIDALFALGEHSFPGAVQLMGSGAVQVVETVKRMGQRHSLQMLPALQKPLDSTAVRRVLQSQNLTAALPAAVTLEQALANNWIEFWYQPKIDLRKRQIAGIETFARVRHPELGTLPPGAFMAGASEKSLVALSERALESALSAAANFSNLGINLRLAVNVPVTALLGLPIDEMVRRFGPSDAKWPGLLLDVTEEQVAAEVDRVHAVSQRLAACGVNLAIDDFGRGRLPLAKLRELPFAELKLDRAFVNGCATDKAKAAICRSVIELAHRLGCIAVGIGIERANEMQALHAMGCDLGQGFLFGQPMPQEEMISALLQRAVVKPAKRPLPAGRAILKRARWE